MAGRMSIDYEMKYATNVVPVSSMTLNLDDNGMINRKSTLPNIHSFRTIHKYSQIPSNIILTSCEPSAPIQDPWLLISCPLPMSTASIGISS